MDALTRLEKGDDEDVGVPVDVSEIERHEHDEGDAEHSYALLTKQYGALFKKNDMSEDDRELNEPLSESIRVS